MFVLSSIILIVSFYGLSKIKSVSFLGDDVPAESSLMKDLKFFESNFSGVMPLEIVVDTKMKKGIQNLNLLKRVDRLEQFLDNSVFKEIAADIKSKDPLKFKDTKRYKTRLSCSTLCCKFFVGKE